MHCSTLSITSTKSKVIEFENIPLKRQFTSFMFLKKDINEMEKNEVNKER